VTKAVAPAAQPFFSKQLSPGEPLRPGEPSAGAAQPGAPSPAGVWLANLHLIASSVLVVQFLFFLPVLIFALILAFILGFFFD